MRAERRQELKTNELSQQLDQITLYVKTNLPKVAGIMAFAALVVGGGYWYLTHQRAKVMDGWTALSADAALAAEGPALNRYELIATQQLSPALTAEALLKVGDAALEEIRDLDPAKAAAKSSLDKETLRSKARDAYEQVVTRFPNDLTASGKALLLLGVLAEDVRDSEKARGYYRKVLETSLYKATPFELQARFRLENLDHWANPDPFPPMLVGTPEPSPLDLQSPPTALTPTSLPAPTTQPAIPSSAAPTTVSAGATPTTPSTASPTTPQPAPTTQPAAAP